MKFSTIFVSAFAALASAAPATRATSDVEPRTFDASSLNNFAFNSLDFGYLSAINSIDFNLLAQLASVNGLNLNGFSNVFSNNVFDLNTLLQLQQIQMLVQLQSLGVLSGFQLNTLVLSPLNLGLINSIGGINLGQFVDQSLVTQLQGVVSQSGIILA